MKTITIKHAGKDYVLGFTRETVSALERSGFEIDNIDRKSATMIPMLVSGAFLLNHKNVKKETIEKIYDGIVGKNDFLAKLMEMYYEPVNALLDDPELEDGKKGNTTWGASW